MRRITEACGVVLATGRPVTMRVYQDDLMSPLLVAQDLRAVLAFEARHPHRGARGVLRQALRERETRTA